MKSLVLLPILLASAYCDILAAVEPIPQQTQTHNTATGEYGFSYSGGPSSKTEFRALDGTTTGTYSYIDANGIVQTVSYIADDQGFRATGTNIPSARKKRQVLLPVAAALPTSSSSQSRFQIHNGAKIIEQVHTPLYPVLHAAPAPLVHQPAVFLRKKRDILAEAPLAYAAPLPPSSAKIYDELAQRPPTVVAAAPALPAVEVRAAAAAVPAAPAVEVRAAAPAVPAVELRAAAPAVPILQNLPISTSSQSRFQVHNGAKIIEQIETPVAAPAAIVEAKAATPIIEAKAAIPAVPVVESLPLSSSSQSRFQIHNGGKFIEEIHTPLYPTLQYAYQPAPFFTSGAFLPAAPLAPAALLPPAPGPLPAESSNAQQAGQKTQKSESGDSVSVESA